MDLLALGNFSTGGLKHPDTTVVGNVTVRRPDGSRAKSRLRFGIANRQISGLVCSKRTRAYGTGDVVEVNFKLNDLLVELPSTGLVDLQIMIDAEEPD